MIVNMLKCPFCNIDKSKFENTILEETQSFYVIPALGSLVDGYVLIINKRHINAMSELTDDEKKEYEDLINKYREIFKDIYRSYPIVFEHGSPNEKDENKASSVLHAHTHIVNHCYNNEDSLIKELNFKRINKITEISKNKNYIFYINPSNKLYVTYDFKPIRQIMRIEIAKDIKMSYKYDWERNKFENNILLTINKIKEYKEKMM